MSPPPDPVIEAIDVGALVRALRASARRLDDAARAVELAESDTRGRVAAARRMREVSVEERAYLARMVRLVDQSGSVSITPRGLRRVVQWWALLALGLFGWVAIVVQWRL